jgi:hypothetical protein
MVSKGFQGILQTETSISRLSSPRRELPWRLGNLEAGKQSDRLSPVENIVILKCLKIIFLDAKEHFRRIIAVLKLLMPEVIRGRLGLFPYLSRASTISIGRDPFCKSLS